jgi:hypothetical protein
MATHTTSKKTLKNFHVRNGLWKLFEVRAKEMDCSIDYLINEAMRLYARTHNFASSVKVEAAKAKIPQGPGAIPPGSGVPPVPGSVRGNMTVPKPMASMRPVRPSAPPLAAGAAVPRPPSMMPSSQAPAPVAPQPPPVQDTAGSVAQRPPLTLIFQGRKLPITSAQFIIGRGSKSSDLAIKDANISRKHAAVIYHNGAYYLKDLGSTNGIEYNGQQVDSKRIDEGDVFNICGYNLHFTYSAV